MRKVVAFVNLTLDGVMQGPGRPEEDTRGNFQHGGWAAPFGAMQSQAAAQSLPETGALLMGRRTYEEFYSFWPRQTGNPFTERLNNIPKYVASATLKEPLPWSHSVLLKNPVNDAVRELKTQPGKDFMIMGSGVLIQSLMVQDLVDLYVLLIHPLILGSGRRLFPEGGVPASLHLIDAMTAPGGVVVASYEPAMKS